MQSTDAFVDGGAVMSISNSTFNVTKLGLAVGTGTLNATNVKIVLLAPDQNPPQIGAQVVNAGGTLTLTSRSQHEIKLFRFYEL